jgi:hypothetical protein
VILIPLLFTLAFAMAILAGCWLVFWDKTVDYVYGVSDFWKNMALTILGCVLMAILEGGVHTWTMLYIVMACVDTSLSAFRIGKRRIIGQGMGLLILIEASFWLWVVWHVYTSR